MGSGNVAVLGEFPPERLFTFIDGLVGVGLNNRPGSSIKRLKPLIDLLVNDVVTVEEKNLSPILGVGSCVTKCKSINKSSVEWTNDRKNSSRVRTHLPTIDKAYFLLNTHDTSPRYTPQAFKFLPRHLERLPRGVELLPIDLARGTRLGTGDGGMYETTGIGDAKWCGGEPEGVRMG